MNTSCSRSHNTRLWISADKEAPLCDGTAEAGCWINSPHLPTTCHGRSRDINTDDQHCRLRPPGQQRGWHPLLMTRWANPRPLDAAQVLKWSGWVYKLWAGHRETIEAPFAQTFCSHLVVLYPNLHLVRTCFLHYGWAKQNIAPSHFPPGCQLGTFPQLDTHQPRLLAGFRPPSFLGAQRSGLDRLGQEEAGIFLVAQVHTVPTFASFCWSAAVEPRGSGTTNKWSFRGPNGAGQLEDYPGCQPLLAWGNYYHHQGGVSADIRYINTLGKK